MCVYKYFSAVKVNVNDALTQIPFNGTNFINARLTSAAGSWGAALSVKHRYYIASLVLYDASIAEITAPILSLSYLYLISSDDGSIIRIFVQINILEGRAGYVD